MIVGKNIENYTIEDIKREMKEEGSSQEFIDQVIGDVESESAERIQKVKDKMKESYERERLAELQKIQKNFRKRKRKINKFNF